MSSNFDLQPDEWVVMKGEPGAHRRDSKFATGRSPRVQELVLTNRNIIVIPFSAFGRAKAAEYHSLGQIRIANGEPQMLRRSLHGEELLELYTLDGQVDLVFTRKKERNAWADNITKLVTASSVDFSAGKDRSIPGAALVAESLKDTARVFRSTFARKAKPVAATCSACGASMSGVAGQVVRCPFCDSRHQL